MPNKMSKKVSRKTRKRPVKKSKKNSYRNFVKKMTPVLRKQNPGLKQPNIMKLIAAEWRKQ
tara:strand:- start:917 stop:1099 length:183 start_codon:yes stop_codon:yes gene_type:complete